eukprot:15213688-Alexandrium_andersonii.AAC.1
MVALCPSSRAACRVSASGRRATVALIAARSIASRDSKCSAAGATAAGLAPPHATWALAAAKMSSLPG